VIQTIERVSQNISTKRQVSIQSELLNADAPQIALLRLEGDFGVVSRAWVSLSRNGEPRLPRFPFHFADRSDRKLFIPCRNGYSHRPDEYAAPEDIARGALVLAEALAKLCSSSR